MKVRTAARTTGWALILALTACASGGGSGGDSAGDSPRGSSTRIIESELASVQQLNGLAAVQRLRPTWLRTRTGGAPQVHLDGNPQMGGIDALRSISAGEIQEMSYMNASDATTRFGTNYTSGVILVTTKR